MTVLITALKVGDVVFDARKEQAGNTMTRRLAVRSVRIVEIDVGNSKVFASWNGNPPRWFRARNGKFSWRRTKSGAPS